jgi:hypothetical protein
MALGALATADVDELLERAAGSPGLTLVVGAGASVEAVLPSWSQLIERLLGRAARALPRLATSVQRTEWIQETVRKDGYLGAAAVVEALSGGNLQSWLIEALFGPGGPGSFEPGPIAAQLAALYLEDPEGIRILTTNYDDLLERSLRQAGVASARVKPYVSSVKPGPGRFAITHLHGYAGRDRTTDLILSEEHYHGMQSHESWQERLMIEQLSKRDCIFIGSSLSDTNLIRYLYRAGKEPDRLRTAIFIRQEDQHHEPLKSTRERAISERWARCGVEPIFLDHYCDVAQLVYEIRLRRHCEIAGETYRPVIDRARLWSKETRREFLGLGSAARFRKRQAELSDQLRDVLDRALERAYALGAHRNPRERLQLVIWLANPDGAQLTGWVHSDRAHRDPSTVQPVGITADSQWVSVRAYCQGTNFQRDRKIYASRWRFVRGLPLISETYGRLPIGCLSLASTFPENRTVLAQMPAVVRAAFNRFIVGESLRLLGP